MKAYKLIFVFFAVMLVNGVSAQNYSNGNVVAKSRDISDNLDLQAVASIFGDSKDLEDFEKKLNDPSMQISNLDLNLDGYVDYLRVLEVAEGDVRVIVIQAVLGQDQFQDVATIELERQKTTASNSSSNVTIQIVGNPYIYGPNYIYEPYYYRPPVFFDFFWMASYRPYYSPWYWGYYPTYYSYWAPVPYYRYNRNCYNYINQNNRYVYTDSRRISRADRMYSNVRGNSLERQNPGRSFEGRNNNVTNRYAFDKERNATRTANFNGNRIDATNGRLSNDRVSNSNGRGEVSTSSRTNGSTVRSESTQTARVSNVNKNSTVNATEVRTTGTRVRSDFNANRVNATQNRVTAPVSTTNRVSSPSRTSDFNQSNNRIERSNSRSNSNSGSFNRSSNSGSFNRSSAPAPSRSMSAPSSSRSSSGGSGRTIGR